MGSEICIRDSPWTDDLDNGELITQQFSEQDSYGIIGPLPNDVNDVKNYVFTEINNTTPGTFDIDLSTFDAPSDIGGTNNLDDFAKLKEFDVNDYSIRIDEVSGGSTYIPGSVVDITSSDITFNTAYSTCQITNLAGVLKITLTANLTKILQVSSVANTDEVYCITSTSHYLSNGEMIYVDGNPAQESGGTTYDEYDGAFPVDSVISPLEFTYKLNQAAVTSPSTIAANVSIFVKSPVLKMYNGHQYLFDLSHSSMVGGNLSFCLLYTSPSPRDRTRSRMPSSA